MHKESDLLENERAILTSPFPSVLEDWYSAGNALMPQRWLVGEDIGKKLMKQVSAGEELKGEEDGK